LEVRNKEQEKEYGRKIKQYEYYQREVVELDEKLGEQKHVEERVREELERVRDELAVSQDKLSK
jgi:hypothetical protein